MTTDTIDALWRAVEAYRCAGWNFNEREEQHAVLGRLIDAYLDADLTAEAECLRSIHDAPRNGRSIFVTFWRSPTTELWQLQGPGDVFGYRAVTATFPRGWPTPRECFEAWLNWSREDSND